MPLSPDEIQDAETLLFRISQLDLENNQSLAKLVPFEDKTTGLLVTSGRIGSDMGSTFKVPIIPVGHVAKLLALQCHQRGHGGVDTTMVRLRNRAWILRGRRIVKAVVYSCIICRKLRKDSLCQVMSNIPDFRIMPNPPFSYCTVDFFGPVLVRGEVNKRPRGKVWGCVYACLSCRAVHVDIARDYGTDGFLLVHRRFQSIRGCPIIMYSDPGINFVGASAELKKFIDSISAEELKRQGGKVGTQWKFHPPDAPHTNGATEVMVKMVKKALQISTGDAAMSFTELQTLCCEAAELVNERPLAISHSRVNEDLELNYLCPNQLLLGRASGKIPVGSWTKVSNMARRTKYVQEVADRFWKEWYKLVFPSVVIHPKWHVERRNLKIGDIVMVADQNALRGDYRLAVVSDVFPDEKGRVRQVQVSYRSPRSDIGRVKRDVRRLVLILPVEEQLPHDEVGGVSTM